MPIGEALVFEGTRWPSARVVGAEPMHFLLFGTTADAAAYSPPRRTIFTLSTTGKGRRWSTDRPLGFWRDFVEIDLENSEAVTAFIRRRGDPQGQLDAGAETHTGHWFSLAVYLRTAAQAWEPEDADGVSSLTTAPDRLSYANFFLRDPEIPVVKDIEPVLDPHGPGLSFRARSLHAFMLMSAASALERRVPMRRCSHCHSWFEALRRDTRYCSSSCRALHNTAKRG